MEWAIPHTQNFFIFNVYKKHLFYTLPIEEYLIKTFNIFIKNYSSTSQFSLTYY